MESGLRCEAGRVRLVEWGWESEAGRVRLVEWHSYTYPILMRLGSRLFPVIRASAARPALIIALPQTCSPAKYMSRSNCSATKVVWRFLKISQSNSHTISVWSAVNTRILIYEGRKSGVEYCSWFFCKLSIEDFQQSREDRNLCWYIQQIWMIS